jgi:hypothetical protein
VGQLLERRGVGYVLAVACDHRVVAGGGTYRADALLRSVPARAWQCTSAGMGAKGHRWYDWAFLRLDDGEASPGGQAGQHWLLVRRNQRTGELAFYRCYAPRPAPPRLVAVTCNEVQHLFAALVAVPVTDTGHRWRWSLWRRRQQARARSCHYQRQAAQQR